MQLTIDTNILVNGFSKVCWSHLHLLAAIVGPGKTICLDCEGHIEKEYRKNLSGREVFEKWYKEVNFDYRYRGKLAKCHADKLTKLGCHEPTDHIFIAVTLESQDKVFLTEDSDMGKGIKGEETVHKKAFDYLTCNLQLKVYDVSEALKYLESLP
jgi:hypothetical protein